MPVATANQTQTSPSSTRRGGKRGGHRGRDGHRGGVSKSRGRKDAVAPNEPLPNVKPTQSEAPPAPDTTEDAARRRDAFGTHLTASGPASNGAQTPQSSGPSRGASVSPQPDGEDPIIAQ